MFWQNAPFRCLTSLEYASGVLVVNLYNYFAFRKFIDQPTSFLAHLVAINRGGKILCLGQGYNKPTKISKKFVNFSLCAVEKRDVHFPTLYTFLKNFKL